MSKSFKPSGFKLHPSAGWTTKSDLEPKTKIFKVCTNCKKVIHFRTECYYVPSDTMGGFDEMQYVCSVICGEIVAATRKIKEI